MSFMFKAKVASESSQYKMAMSQLAHIAQAPLRTAADLKRVSEVIQNNKYRFKYANSRLMETVLDDFELRQFVKSEFGKMSQETRRQWAKSLRNNPQRVLTLPVMGSVLFKLRAARLQNMQMVKILVAALSNFVLERVEETRSREKAGEEREKGSLEQIKGALIKLQRQLKELERKISELSNQTSDAEKKLVFTAVIVTMQIVEEVIGDPQSPAEVVEDAPDPPDTSAVEQCFAEAERKRDECRSNCVWGDAGNACRGVCEAAYVRDTAVCLLS